MSAIRVAYYLEMYVQMMEFYSIVRSFTVLWSGGWHNMYSDMGGQHMNAPWSVNQYYSNTVFQ